LKRKDEVRNMIKKSLLDKIIGEYNKYHGAEARVTLLKQYAKGMNQLLVQFEGSFCFSCAPDEYYTDFLILLEETTGLKFKVKSVKPESNGAVVDFEHVKRDPAMAYVSHF